MKKSTLLSISVVVILSAPPALAFESVLASRTVEASITVTDRVEPGYCGIGVGPTSTTAFSFDDLCSVDTGYGFGQIDVAVGASCGQYSFHTAGAVTSDVICNDGPWGGHVFMQFDWEAVEEFCLATPHSLHLAGDVAVSYSLDPEYGRIQILEGPDFTDVVWSLSISERSVLTLDERIALPAGDYRYIFLLHHTGGSTCDLVQLHFDVTATLATAVSVEPTSFTVIKSLYR